MIEEEDRDVVTGGPVFTTGFRPLVRPADSVRSNPWSVGFAWVVVALAFFTLLGAAVSATPSVLMVPLQDEFGWQRSTVSIAVSVNLLLYGLVAPPAAALRRSAFAASPASACCSSPSAAA
jgi:hypothetical protein